MKKAIITGATGLVGLSVARYFSSIGIEVLCLGRSTINSVEAINLFGKAATYLQVPMEDIQSLEKHLNIIEWSQGNECVFFNFAWCGNKSLTDGDFESQLNNAIQSAQAVQIAKTIGCIKFVNSGTLGETYLERYLNGVGNEDYTSSQTNYTLAKLACRDMCKMIAYMEKIDYVHTRLSVPISPDLSQCSYVSETLKKIIKRVPFIPPKNKALFDIISVSDVAKAYQLIGVAGKNKADYFIGTSRPKTLTQYFDCFEQQVNNRGKVNLIKSEEVDLELFSTEALYRDTGFVATTQFEEIFQG